MINKQQLILKRYKLNKRKKYICKSITDPNKYLVDEIDALILSHRLACIL